MALIKCKECEKEYSNQASTCPNCGCPTTNNMYFPFSSEYEKQMYDKYIELLQQSNTTYTWKVCYDCGKKQELDIQVLYYKPDIDEAINQANKETKCNECGSNNLYITSNMPFPQVSLWSSQSKEYKALYLTLPKCTSIDAFYLSPRDETNIRALPVLHPYYVVQDWENNLPEEVKKKIASYRPNKTPLVVSSSNTSKKNEVHCPKCGSTQIQMVQRKWSLLTGFMTNKVDRVCVNCKHKF